MRTCIKRDFTRRRVIVNHIYIIWSAHLVAMQNFSKWSKGYEYLHMVIDVYGNYGWIKPLKDRKGKTITEVFKTIFKEGRQPQYLWVDKGKEFYNKHLKELLDKHSIKYTQQKMKKNPVLLKDGIEQCDRECGNSSQFTATQLILIFCHIY